MLAATVTGGAKGLGERYQRDEEYGEDSLDADHRLYVRLATPRTRHRKTSNPTRSPTHSKKKKHADSPSSTPEVRAISTATLRNRHHPSTGGCHVINRTLSAST